MGTVLHQRRQPHPHRQALGREVAVIHEPVTSDLVWMVATVLAQTIRSYVKAYTILLHPIEGQRSLYHLTTLNIKTTEPNTHPNGALRQKNLPHQNKESNARSN